MFMCTALTTATHVVNKIIGIIAATTLDENDRGCISEQSSLFPKDLHEVFTVGGWRLEKDGEHNLYDRFHLVELFLVEA